MRRVDITKSVCPPLASCLGLGIGLGIAIDSDSDRDPDSDSGATAQGVGPGASSVVHVLVHVPDSRVDPGLASHPHQGRIPPTGSHSDP